MSYVCVKPITLLGNSTSRELIQDGHILPSRERALVRTGCTGCIAEVAGGAELPVAELVQVKRGRGCISVPVVQESLTGTQPRLCMR